MEVEDSFVVVQTEVFCQNAEDQQLLVDNRLVPRARLTLPPGSGVDLQRFNPSLRQPRGNSFRFLYAGRMLANGWVPQTPSPRSAWRYLRRRGCGGRACGARLYCQ